MLLVNHQEVLMDCATIVRSALIDSKGTSTPAVRQKSKEYLPKSQWEGGGGNKALKDFTPRELLKELKSRGYIWENMYVKREVVYEDIY